MKLIFIRHAEPDYTIDSLTEKGWREAKLLAKRTKDWKNITDVYCSPLGRAKDTASFTLKEWNKEAIELPWLQEFWIPVIDPITGKQHVPWDFYPSYWTKNPEFYKQDEWYKHPIYDNTNIEERYFEVINNFDQLLSKYGYNRNGNFYTTDKENDDTTLVFFCHLGVSFLIYSHLLNIPTFLLWHDFFVAPSSVTILGSEEREKKNASFRIQTLGDTRHLAMGNEPISSSGYFTDCFQL